MTLHCLVLHARELLRSALNAGAAIEDAVSVVARLCISMRLF